MLNFTHVCFVKSARQVVKIGRKNSQGFILRAELSVAMLFDLLSSITLRRQLPFGLGAALGVYQLRYF